MCRSYTSKKKKILIKPLNALEKENDKKKIWRKYVNKELKGYYKKIFNLVDLYIFLKVPSLNMFTNGDCYKKKN